MERLVFAHGWGFHAGVWASIVPHFADYDICYCGPEYVSGGPALQKDIPTDAIWIGYSVGLAWLLTHARVKPKALVSIAGFDSLCARGRSKAVRDIQSGLARNAGAQMRAFWATCGVKPFAPLDTLNVTELKRGLEFMLEVDARDALAGVTCPVLALASTDDRVVPYELAQQMFARDVLVSSQTGGHGLVLTRPDWCVKEIQRFL